MSALPDQIALTDVGGEITASPINNNDSAVQTAVNAVIAALSGGSAGQILTASNGTTVAWAAAPATIIAHDKQTSTKSSTATAFSSGTDLLDSALSFTADGTSDYIVRVTAPQWSNNTSSQTNILRLNLDGADGGTIAVLDVNAGAGGNGAPLNAACLLVAPSAGSHTVNARLLVSSGSSTGTVSAGGGGAGTNMAAFITIEKA